MSPSRNAPRGRNAAGPGTGGLVRPLTPRSVIASLLLGMHPPRMRGALLVRWCAHLGIAEGTTRVALSRMVDAGELQVRDGRYELAGRLRSRQSGQDWALEPAVLPWDGEWVLWLVRPGARSPLDRAELRRAAEAARLVELRDGTWGRPHNLPPEATPAPALATLGAQATRWTARPEDGVGPAAAELFGLGAVEARARALLAELEVATAGLTGKLEPGMANRADPPADRGGLGRAFALGAATLQQIRRDPLLPAELAGPDWPGPALRAGYARYQAAFAAALTDWFAHAERAVDGPGPSPAPAPPDPRA